MLERIRQWLLSWQRPWGFAVPATAVAALFSLIWVWPWAVTPDLEAQISARYASVLAQDSVEFAQHLEALALAQASTSFAFSEAEPSPSVRAFGAGLWAGRETLLGRGSGVEPPPKWLSSPTSGNWIEDPRGDYYAFGRWAVLAWALAESEHPTVDWAEHTAIVEELLTRFEARAPEQVEDTQARAALGRIRLLIEAVREGAEPTAQVRLSRALLTSMQLFGPPA
jgi:hypothetical protein